MLKISKSLPRFPQIFPLFLLFFSAFLISVSPGFAEQTDSSYEIAITKALDSIENAKYEHAVRELREILSTRPDDEKAMLYLGIALSRLGDGEAEASLKKALKMNPQNPRTNLELGIFYYHKSNKEEAEDYLENVVSLAPDTGYSKKAKQYLSSLQKRETVRPLALNISVGAQYDNNVVLDSGAAPLPEGISRKSDWSAVIYLKGKYNFVNTGTVDASAGYSFYQNLHVHLSDFNVMDNLFDLTATFRISSLLSLKTAYAFDYLLVGGDPYNYAHVVSPSLIISEGKGFSTILEYRYKNMHYINSSLFDTNSDRTGFNNMAGITQNIPLGSYVNFRVSYAYDKETPKKEFWEYTGNKGMAGLQFNLPVGLYLNLSGEYYNKNYKEHNPAVSSRTRKDEVLTASISATKTLSRVFSFTLGQLYVRNKSNIEVFDYERAVTSFFINARF